MQNHLKDQTSPYLLQHADNPVNWYPWCDEAFARAKEEDKPILLSIGYSTCHWCHVMAHESFEDEQIAEILNQYFISIKVDKEERPESKMDWFAFGPGDYVSVHYESTPHIHKTVAAIRKKGAKAIVALNPGTPIQVLENLLDDIDGVLVMTVDPGFAGQKLVEACAGKVKKLREYLDTNGYPDKEIEVDGNISFENAGRMNRMGADIFVAGSSSVFSGEGSIGQNIARVREVLRQLY